MNTLRDLDLKGKRVLLRAGFDVPLKDGKIKDTERIESVIPTIEYLRKLDCKIIIIAHQGRPKGEVNNGLSQQPVADSLAELMDIDVDFIDDCIGKAIEEYVQTMERGDVVLLENLRFHKEEKANDVNFAKELAALADVYINDAFCNSHRDHASMTGVPKLLSNGIGLHFEKELKAIDAITEEFQHPFVVIAGGAKTETKVPMIKQFLKRADHIVLGGVVGNTFQLAEGFDIGESKADEDLIETAQEILLIADHPSTATVHIPQDVIVASEAKEDAVALDLPVEDIELDMQIYDIGRLTREEYADYIRHAKTIIWNGPVGVTSYSPFAGGTIAIAKAVVEATNNGAQSLLGGGDTLGFLQQHGINENDFTHVSTGGGAMLQYLSGGGLVALDALK
jgi:phosphoglycerate kinase